LVHIDSGIRIIVFHNFKVIQIIGEYLRVPSIDSFSQVYGSYLGYLEYWARNSSSQMGQQEELENNVKAHPIND
jgi:hypothetical protein